MPAHAAKATTAPAIRAVLCELVDLRGARVSRVTIVSDDRLPEVVMFEGDPFLHAPEIGAEVYRQVRPFHAIRC